MTQLVTGYTKLLFLTIAVCTIYTCYPTIVFGQTATSVPGDKLLDITIGNVINHPNKTLNISDFKGKLVILDFWATWCSSCINAFPKLISLQQEFKEQVQIILVNSSHTGDTEEKINSFLNKWQQRNGMKVNLPIIVYDTLLTKMLPHKIIPHYVWFDKAGDLIGTTASDQVNTSIIENLLENKVVHFNTKKDIDATKPLFISNDLPIRQLQQYSILVKGWQPGLTAGSRTRTNGNVKNSWALTNMPLLTIYNMVYERLNPGMNRKQFILEVRDSARLIAPASEALLESWMQHNLYSVDMVVPVEHSDHLPQVLLDYLNTYSGFVAGIEKRTITCWVLSMDRKNIPLQTKGGKPENDLSNVASPKMINQPMSRLVEILNDIKGSPLFIDETHCTSNIDLYFKRPLIDLEVIQQELLKVGLKLQLAERTINMVVLREKAGN